MAQLLWRTVGAILEAVLLLILGHMRLIGLYQCCSGSVGNRLGGLTVLLDWMELRDAIFSFTVCAGDVDVLGGGPSSPPGAGPSRGPAYGLPQLDKGTLRQGHPLQRCLNVIDYVMHHPAAAPFCSQACSILRDTVILYPKFLPPIFLMLQI